MPRRNASDQIADDNIDRGQAARAFDDADQLID